MLAALRVNINLPLDELLRLGLRLLLPTQILLRDGIEHLSRLAHGLPIHHRRATTHAYVQTAFPSNAVPLNETF